MKWLALICLLPASRASADSLSATMRVQVVNSKSLTFNHLVQNTLSVQTPWGTQKAVFSGTPYAPDPQNYWSHLFPLTLQLKAPPHTKAGSYPVRASAQLYLCDQKAHVCTVRTAETSGEITVGYSPARPALLTLTVPVFEPKP